LGTKVRTPVHKLGSTSRWAKLFEDEDDDEDEYDKVQRPRFTFLNMEYGS
jgi:hypothetical protein